MITQPQGNSIQRFRSRCTADRSAPVSACFRKTVCLLCALLLTPGYLLAELDQSSAARFLSQATLGYTEADISRFQKSGYQKWIDQQLKKTPTLLEPYIASLYTRRYTDADTPRGSLPYHKVNSKGNNVGYRNISTAWMRAVLRGDDRLRQRVAWALSQIIVTANGNNRLTQGSANYYDLLLKNAFSSYEDLLIDVTFHPVMGRYLSYMGNKKPNAKKNQQPDENYAREIMQLFTIGLWQLNLDGSRKLDNNGDWIPTYSNNDITELARVFTGFWLSDTRFSKIDWEKFATPMSISDRHHDRQSKSLLDGQIQIEAKMNPETEIHYTIRKLLQHSNVAPFLSRKLINHLVTSNPTKQYIKRISTVWLNTNGNLGKVVEAILLDPEARESSDVSRSDYGRLKDPIQRLTNILIGFECSADIGKEPDDYPGLQWWRPDPFKHLSQAPMQAPSVFNFYESEYTKPGMIADAQLYSPEFQILNDATASTVPNYIWRGLTGGFHKPVSQGHPSGLHCRFPGKIARPLKDTLSKANLLLAADAVDKDTLLAIEKIITSGSRPKAHDAVFAIAISPSATIQR